MIKRVCNVCGNYVLVVESDPDVYCPCEAPANYMKSDEERDR